MATLTPTPPVRPALPRPLEEVRRPGPGGPPDRRAGGHLGGVGQRLARSFAARQAGLLLVAVSLYFGVRHLTEGAAPVAVRNAGLVIDLERRLGVFHELDVQRWALDADGVVAFFDAVYIWGHWPVIAAVLGWLAWRRRDAFVTYRNALLLSGLVGMVVVALFPVAPPRLMDLGFVDTVVAHTDAYRVLQPPSFTNQYAAMPSFHVGWDLLVGIALAREASWGWARAAGRALPALMLAAVVVTGNHYLLDAVAGDAIVLACLAVSSRSFRPGDTVSRVAARRQQWPVSSDVESLGRTAYVVRRGRVGSARSAAR